MTRQAAMATNAEIERTTAASLRSFTIAEGILLLVLGILALVFPMVASAWVTVIVAIAFLVGGVVGWVSNLTRARRLSRWHCFSRLVISTLFLVVGVWIIQQFSSGPLAAGLQVAALAYAVGIVFVVEGLMSTVVSLSHTRRNGWGWGLANGIVTLILGVLILSMKAWGLMSVLGILVGISFLFSGIDLLAFSAAFHAGEDA
jgi:uncharacterized membrane protein HdeD (DUF308 family)